MRENTLTSPTASTIAVPTDRRTPPWRARPANQQPDWEDHDDYRTARDQLRRSEPLVTLSEIDELTSAMGAVAAGRAQILQIGDCAEDIDECTGQHAAEKLALLAELASELEATSARPVVRIGRLGGQFAKPRSKPTEMHGDVELPAFRGHLVNSAEPTVAARAHDPSRLVAGYAAGADVHDEVRRHLADEPASADAGARRGPWSSHEALVIDYEDALIRRDDAGGRRYLASTHFPWIGERTRDPEHGHVALLASVVNPCGCKIGPSAVPEDVLAVCEALDPHRRPGRLTLISRMGRDDVERVLPPIIEAVAAAGHPVVWMCDPMHGNTVLRSGVKTRVVEDVVEEIRRFRAIVADAGAVPGGLHLEAAGRHLTECIGGDVDEDRLGERYESLCDPRLNHTQAREVLAAWMA